MGRCRTAAPSGTIGSTVSLGLIGEQDRAATGERDILRIWADDGGEGAKYWLNVLTEITNRGVKDVCIVVCDCLKGLPDAI